jgi:hypothetical protein
MIYFRCRTEFCSIAHDALLGLLALAALGGIISLWSSGSQLFSAG